MAEHAIHPPIHLVTHPDEPIRSLEAAAKVIHRHAGDHLDRNAQDLLQQIKRASTLQEADAVGTAFRAWAEALRPAPGPAGRRKGRLSRELDANRERLRSAEDDAEVLNAHLRSRIDAIALT
jgi:hypothetical protein